MGFFDWLTGANKTQENTQNLGPILQHCPKNPGIYCNLHDRSPFDSGHDNPLCAHPDCYYGVFGSSDGVNRYYHSGRKHTVSPSHSYCEQHSFFEGKPSCQLCSRPVSRPEFKLCLKHWTIEKNNKEREEKNLRRELKRTISHSKRYSYNRLLNTTSRYLRKPIEMCTDREVMFCLIQDLHIPPREASAFVNSDAVKGVAGWLPPIDVPGQESKGYEWTEFKGANWYRSLTIPGPWTRYGATPQPQQPRQTSEQNPVHSTPQSEGQTVIQNITYNIQDSAISGDINADINRINKSEHQ